MEAFFQSWELYGNFPQILRIKKLAQLLEIYGRCKKDACKNQRRKIISPSAVIGFWPANSIDDDILVYEDDTRKKVIETLIFFKTTN